MRRQIREFFVIPAELRLEFWRVACQRNHVSLLVICVMIFGMELFNMARVLLWSSSGLGTLNNRIYFGLYCALFLSAAVCLLLEHLLRERTLRARLTAQFGSVLFFLLWHVCINAYDLCRDADAEYTIYLTAVLGVAAFILMPAAAAAAVHLSAYVLLMLLVGGILSDGDRVNLTFTAIVALAISLTSCRHHVTVISQRMEISRMNEQLQLLVQRDPLTGLLNKTAFQSRVESGLGTAGMALLMVDLDDFKAVNDQYGHLCGDFVLKEVALRVEAAFPDAVGIGRVGGDEFTVFLDGRDAERLEAAARTLIQSVSRITWQDQALGTGCSVGGCRIAGPCASYEQLYSETDRALYQAKAEGKGRFCLRELGSPGGQQDG